MPPKTSDNKIWQETEENKLSLPKTNISSSICFKQRPQSYCITVLKYIYNDISCIFSRNFEFHIGLCISDIILEKIEAPFHDHGRSNSNWFSIFHDFVYACSYFVFLWLQGLLYIRLSTPNHSLVMNWWWLTREIAETGILLKLDSVVFQLKNDCYYFFSVYEGITSITGCTVNNLYSFNVIVKCAPRALRLIQIDRKK